MLRSFNSLRGIAIRATDGRIGTVSDVYFDDSTWRVRYCVVDSDQWFANRYVLIGARALSVLDSTSRELWVRLSKAEIKRSRRAASDKPVSKQPIAVSGDRHLRSCKAVIGHRLSAIDGEIGQVDDFLLDNRGWVVRQLVVDTRQSANARVLVAPQRVSGISWPDATVSVDLTHAAVLAAPGYDPDAAAGQHELQIETQVSK